MSIMLQILHEQLLEYSSQLKDIKAEIIRKYKAGENYSADVSKASGIKMMQEECLKMMAFEKIKKNNQQNNGG